MLPLHFSSDYNHGGHSHSAIRASAHRGHPSGGATLEEL